MPYQNGDLPNNWASYCGSVWEKNLQEINLLSLYSKKKSDLNWITHMLRKPMEDIG